MQAYCTGPLRLGGTAALGTGTFTITGGAFDSTVANLSTTNLNVQAWNGDFTFVGTNNLTLGTTTSVGGAVTMSGNRTVTVDAGMLTVQGAIGDGGSGYGITKNGAGTLRLNGTNSFTGTTTINEGWLSIYNDFNLSGTARADVVYDIAAGVVSLVAYVEDAAVGADIRCGRPARSERCAGCARCTLHGVWRNKAARAGPATVAAARAGAL